MQLLIWGLIVMKACYRCTKAEQENILKTIGVE